MRLMLIFQCILSLQSQFIDFTDYFSRSYNTSGEPVFVKLPWDFMSDGEQGDVVLMLKKIIYGQAEEACLFYETLKNSFFWI